MSLLPTIVIDGKPIPLEQFVPPQPEVVSRQADFPKCEKLSLRQVPALITVTKSHDEQIHVMAGGTAEMVENLSFKHCAELGHLDIGYTGVAPQPCTEAISTTDADQVLVTWQGGEAICGADMVHLHNGRNIWIELKRRSLQMELTIALPAGTNIFYQDTPNAQLEVEDIRGDLDLRASANGRIHAVSAKSLHVELTGSSDVLVDNLYGDENQVVLNLHGSGHINIGRGLVQALQVHLTGSGSINVCASAYLADLILNGSGNISTGMVFEKVTCERTGSGLINVCGQTKTS